MNYFIFLGPPGSGKGTQCALLKERLGCVHISTGEIVRKQIACNSDLGKQIKDIVESGHFVDDNIILKCFVEHLNAIESQDSNQIILLDGIPRNINQAEYLNKVLNLNIKGVIALTASLDDLLKRFSKRWICILCQRIVSLSESDISTQKCPFCGSINQFAKRKDDAPEVISERFKIYSDQTKPLLSYYKNNVLYQCNGLQPVERIYVYLASIILQKVYGNC